MVGYTDQAAQSIVINATGAILNNGVPSSCVIAPIRNLNGPASQRLYYSPAGAPGQVGEITWGTDESSLRYKQNVVDLPSRFIDGIHKLRPVEFEFKARSNQRRVGLIAEEVAEHIPEVVVHNALDDTLVEGLEYEHLVAPLIAIVQNYRKQLDVHKSQLAEHETIIQDQRTQLSNYETRIQALEQHVKM
jgi:Chaperone of endosialidase